MDLRSKAMLLALYVEEIRYGKAWNSRVTVALPDSRHPRIAVFSGAISSESHINGSRTQGVADAPQTFDHYAVHCWECLLPRGNDDR